MIDLLDAPSAPGAPGARVAPGAVRAALRAVPTLPGALTAPQRRRAVVIRRPPPYVVACFLARAVQGDAACAAIHEAAAQLLGLLTLGAADPMLGLAMGRAITLRDGAAALPEADRAPVVVAMLRDLLDDAPTRAAVEMDQALVRAARECGTTPTALEHAERAQLRHARAQAVRPPRGVDTSRAREVVEAELLAWAVDVLGIGTSRGVPRPTQQGGV